ncbi:L,D-transpeptidase family protein [Microbacterium sp. A588]
MTDLAATPGADTAQTTVVTPAPPPPGGSGPSVEWAPHEPAPKKRRVGLWVGIGAGALLVAAGVASVFLIAPGTTIAGVPVGGLTPGGATDAVNSRLANLEITLTDVADEQVITGAELGAAIDAGPLAEEAFAAHPMWKLGEWMPEPLTGTISVDPELATDALRALIPASYTDAVDATVAFDAGTGTYVSTAAEAGTGINLADLTTAITEALTDGESSMSYSAAPAESPALISDQEAATTVEELNTMLAAIGFYVGEERTVPVEPAVAATWLNVSNDGSELNITADESAIQAVVDTLPELVNRAAVNADVIVNGAGDVLREIVAGVSGRELGDVSNAASDFAEQLQSGDAAFELNVNETAFETTTRLRQIDINLATQTITVLENGNAIDSWLVSSGVNGFNTHTGSYQVGWKTSSQNMGNRDLAQAPHYFQPNVKSVMYFNGDQAIHGVYWHEAWGTPKSHGCVGMPEWRAQWLYDWSPEGVGINIHY